MLTAVSSIPTEKCYILLINIYFQCINKRFHCRYCVCGIVLSPFCWLKGEWVGLTFLAAIKPLVTYIQQNSESSNCAVHPFSTCSLDHILVSGSESSLQLDDETLSFTPSHVIKEARLVPGKNFLFSRLFNKN